MDTRRATVNGCDGRKQVSCRRALSHKNDTGINTAGTIRLKSMFSLAYVGSTAANCAPAAVTRLCDLRDVLRRSSQALTIRNRLPKSNPRVVCDLPVGENLHENRARPNFSPGQKVVVSANKIKRAFAQHETQKTHRSPASSCAALLTGWLREPSAPRAPARSASTASSRCWCPARPSKQGAAQAYEAELKAARDKGVLNTDKAQLARVTTIAQATSSPRRRLPRGCRRRGTGSSTCRRPRSSMPTACRAAASWCIPASSKRWISPMRNWRP